MSTAPPTDQWRLLDVQAHDTRLDQLAHRRRTLPEHADVQRLQEQRTALRDQLVSVETAAGDVRRELAKAEADVELVRQRTARDQARLDSGAGSAKDLTALQHEVETLGRRQNALEDVELEVMERLEERKTEVGRLSAAQGELDRELADVSARLEQTCADIDADSGRVQAERSAAAAGLDPALLALYEKVRQSSDGIGAAILSARRCQGCHLELTPTDLNRIRSAAPEEVLRCEECRRILVRTASSGL